MKNAHTRDFTGCLRTSASVLRTKSLTGFFASGCGAGSIGSDMPALTPRAAVRSTRFLAAHPWPLRVLAC